MKQEAVVEDEVVEQFKKGLEHLKDGKFIAVGTNAEVENLKGDTSLDHRPVGLEVDLSLDLDLVVTLLPGVRGGCE